jgi:hypothetical protein
MLATQQMIDSPTNPNWSPFTKKVVRRIKECPTVIPNMKTLVRDTKWMRRCTLLCTDEDVVHNMTEVAGNGGFQKGSLSVQELSVHDLLNPYRDILKQCGLFLHTDCWKFIKAQYGIKLTYGMMPPMSVLSKMEVGETKLYWQHFFSFDGVAVDQKMHLCSSPLVGDRNIGQIKRNIRQLKLKRPADTTIRPSPPVSATFFEPGDIKMSFQSGEPAFFIQQSNKWVHMKGVVVETETNYRTASEKQLRNLGMTPFVGQHSKKPLFIKSVGEKKNTVVCYGIVV